MLSFVACAQQDVAAPGVLSAGQRALASGGVAPTGADLQLSGSIPFGSPNVGTTFAYSFQVKNSGPSSAEGTTLVDVLPPGMLFAQAQLNGTVIACPQTDQTVTCDLGTIPSGAQSMLVFLATTPMVPVTDTNTATVTSLVADPKTTNNTVNILTKVQTPNLGGVKPVPVQLTAFSSLPADFTSGGYTIAGGAQGLAFAFVSAATGTFSGLAVAMHGSGIPGRAGFWIYADNPNNPGHPGALISAEAFGTIPALNDGTYTVVSVSPIGAPVLVAGQRYWLFGFGAAGEGAAQWDLTANLFLSSPVAQGSPGGPIFLVPGNGLGRMAAFIVGVTP
ncbi:MAG TPA: DUF11 domain-containing protein [Gemmatimonadaceae bacterium]|nr:DUF11 domain-containing protein [Gemmatimonadaceae bacterium]